MKGRPQEKYIPTLAVSGGFRDAFMEALQRGPVQLDNFGTFEIVSIASKRGFHNFSGKKKTFPAYKKLKFTQSKDMKTLLKK